MNLAQKENICDQDIKRVYLIDDQNKQEYTSGLQKQIDNALEKFSLAVLENPTNIGKEEIIAGLVNKYGKTLFISQSYGVNYPRLKSRASDYKYS